MRLWSLHPKYLDKVGLGAVWREGLLAQSVLARLAAGEKPGYRNHPQLERFKAAESPLRAIAAYLDAIQEEATRRGYHYNRELILSAPSKEKLTVTKGQLSFEKEHLWNKLYKRGSAQEIIWLSCESFLYPKTHSLFNVIKGPIESWEKV